MFCYRKKKGILVIVRASSKIENNCTMECGAPEKKFSGGAVPSAHEGRGLRKPAKSREARKHAVLASGCFLGKVCGCSRQKKAGLCSLITER